MSETTSRTGVGSDEAAPPALGEVHRVAFQECVAAQHAVARVARGGREPRSQARRCDHPDQLLGDAATARRNLLDDTGSWEVEGHLALAQVHSYRDVHRDLEVVPQRGRGGAARWRWSRIGALGGADRHACHRLMPGLAGLASPLASPSGASDPCAVGTFGYALAVRPTMPLLAVLALLAPGVAAAHACEEEVEDLAGEGDAPREPGRRRPCRREERGVDWAGRARSSSRPWSRSSRATRPTCSRPGSACWSRSGAAPGWSTRKLALREGS